MKTSAKKYGQVLGDNEKDEDINKYIQSCAKV